MPVQYAKGRHRATGQNRMDDVSGEEEEKTVCADDQARSCTCRWEGSVTAGSVCRSLLTLGSNQGSDAPQHFFGHPQLHHALCCNSSGRHRRRRRRRFRHLLLREDCSLHVPQSFEVDEAHDRGGRVDGPASPMAWCGSSIRQAVRLCGKARTGREWVNQPAHLSLAPPTPRRARVGGLVCTPTFSHSRISTLAFRFFASSPWIAYRGNPKSLRLRLCCAVWTVYAYRSLV